MAVLSALVSVLLMPAPAGATDTVYVDKSSMVFGGETGGADAAPERIYVNAGTREVSWDVDKPWLDVFFDQYGFRMVRADTSSLSAGTYVGHVTFGALGYLPATVTVTAVISPKGELVPNGGFEGTSGPWSVSSGLWKASGDFPRTGSGNLAFTQTGQRAFYDVKVPTRASAISVSISLRISSQIYWLASDDPGRDKLIVKTPAGNGNYGREFTYWDRTGTTPGSAVYRTYEIPVPAFSFRFELLTDFSAPGACRCTEFRVDDVSVKWRPILGSTPAALSFDAVAGGPTPGIQALSLWNGGGGEVPDHECIYQDPDPTCDRQIPWTASDNQSWLSLSATAGGHFPGTKINVAVSPGGLAVGTYSGTITVSAGGGTANSPLVVPVTLTVRRPTLAVDRNSLYFSGPMGGANPSSQPLSLSNPQGGAFSWAVADNQPWLSMSPPSGSLPATASSAAVTLSVSTAGLAAGTYTATITVTATAALGVTGSPFTVAVTLDVRGPTLSVSGTNTPFFAEQGGANPASKDLVITNLGGGSFSWTLAESIPWLSVPRTSGTQGAVSTTTATSRLAMAISTAGLAAGTYTGTITVTATGAAGSPKSVTVTLVVSPAGAIVNGDFEADSDDPWVLLGGSEIDDLYPHSGDKYLNLEPDSYDDSAWAYQRIAIPSTVTTADLRFWLGVTSQETSPGAYDELTVEVEDAASGALLGTLATYSNLDKGGGYIEKGPFNLVPYRGKQVNIVFSSWQNQDLPTTFRIDDVSMTLATTTIPKLGVTPSSLSFSATVGGANPAAKTLSISNNGGGTMSWTASDNQGWLSVSPASGSQASITTSSATVSVSTAGLAAGTYTGAITISASGATGSPVTIPVTVTVNPLVVVANGGFEGSASPWVLSGRAYWTRTGYDPNNGLGYLYLGDSDYATGAAYQTVTIPATAVGELHLWLNVTTDDYCCAHDKLFVEIRDTAGALLATPATYSNDDDSIVAGNYDERIVNLSAFKGRTVRLQFRVVNDYYDPTTFRIDDVSIR